MFEKAFGLPTPFAQIDIDKQAEVLRDKADRLFGSDSLAVFQDAAAVDKLIDRFLARAQIEEGAAATGPAADGADAAAGDERGSGSSGLWNLLASRELSARYWIVRRRRRTRRSPAYSSVAT